jgi:aspartate/methionine/tyrosine aminotransferase
LGADHLQLSEKILSIKPPPIRFFADKASNTPGCARLDQGEPDFDTPRHIKRAAIEAIRRNFTHYTSTYGVPELRDAVAEKESVKVSGLSRNNVLITTGGMGALFCASASILDFGQEIILENPSWATYSYMVTIAGGKAVFVKFFEDDKLKPENITEKINNKTRAIIVNTPQNPTGRVWSREEVKAIAEIAREYNLFVICDEVYEKIIYGRKHVSFAEYDKDLSNTILVNSFSKTYAMTGWRIGYAVGDEAFIPSMLRVNRATTTCPNAFAQMGALAALKGSQNSVKKMVSRYRKRRDYIFKRMRQIGLKTPQPDGAFYVFPDVSDYDKDSMRFSNNLIENAKVSCIPGVGFGSEGEGHIRFCYATSIDEIEKGMIRLEKFLKNYPEPIEA